LYSGIIQTLPFRQKFAVLSFLPGISDNGTSPVNRLCKTGLRDFLFFTVSNAASVGIGGNNRLGIVLLYNYLFVNMSFTVFKPRAV
jgi:hypothetical protein